MGQRAVWLTNEQEELSTTPIAPRDDQAFAKSRVIAIANDRFNLLIPGSMSLLRPAPANRIWQQRSALPRSRLARASIAAHWPN
jgi:hypothetical protein